MWLTVKEAAKKLEVTTKTIRRRIKSGEYETKYELFDNNHNGKTKTLLIYIVADLEVKEAEQPSEEPQPVDGWVPLESATSLAGVSKRTLYRKINNGEVLAISQPDLIGKPQTMIKLDSLEIENKSIAIAEITKSDEEKEFAMLSFDAKEIAWARLALVRAYRSARQEAKNNKISLVKATERLVERLNFLEECEPEMRLLGKVSIQTLRRWEKAYRDAGDPELPLVLADKRQISTSIGRPKETSKAFRDQVKKMAWDFRNLHATEIYRLIEREKAYVGKEMPLSLRAVSSIVAKARQDDVAMSISKGKKAWKDTVRPHVHRINNAAPGDIYESDGHKMNNLILSPFYAHRPSFRFLVRPIVVVWYDIATGMIVGYCMTVAETPNSVRTSLRDALENWGIPSSIRIDNGSSYKNTDHCPHEFAGQRGNSKAKTKAIEMIIKGDMGLYRNLGINYSFTIPGNAESKMIEPFWGFCVSRYEKAFPVWIGNKIETRHEELRKTNQALLRKYGKAIPTWEEYDRLFGLFVAEWNNEKRPVLRNAVGEKMSPLEVFEELSLKKLSRYDADRLIRDPYPQISTVSRGEVLVNGIYYSHPMFLVLNGRRIKYWYDEKNIGSLLVGSEHGEMLPERAKMVMPGLQVGDDMEALADTRRREKEGKLAYLAMQEHIGTGSIRAKQRALDEMASNTLEEQNRLQELRKDDKISLEGRRSIRRENKKQISVEITDAQWEEIQEKAIADQEREKMAAAARRAQEAIEAAEWEATQKAQIQKNREEEEQEYTQKDLEEAFRKLGIQ
ncbi:MAG: hypothetical protein WDA18_09220 [Candidatus Ratteibacteria bacterium]